MITVDEDIKYKCHIAALRAIDRVLNKHLVNRKYWITDAELPALLPHIDYAIDQAVNKPAPTPRVR